MATKTKPTGDELLEEILGTGEPETPIEGAPEDLDPEERLRRLSQRKPPAAGNCRRCGRNKPINRMMLCYPCWVKSNLERKGWREGMPHPEWCRCEGLGSHPERPSEYN